MNMDRKAWSVASALALASIVTLSPSSRAAPDVAVAPPAGAPSTSQHPMAGNGGPMSGMHGDAGMPQTRGMDMTQHHQQMMAQTQSMHGGAPSLPGQDAFGAIGEIVAMLEADPATDWSKVDIEALRRHLVDMNEVTLNAEAVSKSVDGGVEIRVTGTGRTLAAIQRMVPMHAAEIDGLNGWSAKASLLADGTLLTVTSNNPKESQHIRGLGFAGLMVSGAHHQAHHLAMAKGEPMHRH
jgi:hypothetical protein